MPVVVMPDGVHVMMPDTPPADLATPTAWDSVKPYAVAAARGVPMAIGGMLGMVKDPMGGGPTALSEVGDFIQKKTNEYLPAAKGGNPLGKATIEGATGGLVAPGGPIKALVTGGMAGLGGEAASELTNGNPIARVLGALAGGVTGGIGANSVRTGSAQARAVAQTAVEGLPPGALEKAQAFQAEAATRGVKLDLVQALEGTGVPAPALKTVRDVLAGKAQGGQVQSTLQAQPGQLEVAGDVAIGGLPGKVREPNVAANNLADIATQRIQAAKNARTAATQPLYDSAGPLPPEAKKSITDALNDALTRPGITSDAAGKIQEALASIKAAPGTGARMTHAADFDTMIRELAGPFKGQPLSGSASAFLGTLVPDLKQTLRDASPGIKAGAATHAQISQDVVDPLKQGPVGQMAGRRGYLGDVQTPVSRMTGIFEKGTDPQASTSSIKTLGAEINKSDPSAFADAAKTYYSGKLGQSFDATLGAGQASNPDAAGRIVRNLFQDRNQWQGMKDAAEVIAQGHGLNPDEVIKGLENFAAISKAAANRPSSISGVSASDIAEMGGKTLGTRGMKSVGIQPLKPLADMVEAATLSKTYATFDQLLTSPDGAATLAKLGRVPATSPAAAAILSTWAASQDPQPKK